MGVGMAECAGDHKEDLGAAGKFGAGSFRDRVAVPASEPPSAKPKDGLSFGDSCSWQIFPALFLTDVASFCL